MFHSKAKWGLCSGGGVCGIVGLLCIIVGFVIAMDTISYANAHEDEFRRIDTTGIPTGPIVFVIMCGLPLLLAAILCAVGIVLCTCGIGYGWRSPSQRESSVLESRVRKKKQVVEDSRVQVARRKKSRRPAMNRLPI